MAVITFARSRSRVCVPFWFEDAPDAMRSLSLVYNNICNLALAFMHTFRKLHIFRIDQTARVSRPSVVVCSLDHMFTPGDASGVLLCVMYRIFHTAERNATQNCQPDSQPDAICITMRTRLSNV